LACTGLDGSLTSWSLSTSLCLLCVTVQAGDSVWC
jgi:hypothetical protein